MSGGPWLQGENVEAKTTRVTWGVFVSPEGGSLVWRRRAGLQPLCSLPQHPLISPPVEQGCRRFPCVRRPYSSNPTLRNPLNRFLSCIR